MTDAEVFAAVQGHLRAFNARDLDAVLDGFADDAVFATGEHLMVGRRALRAMFTEAFAIPADVRLELRASVVQGDTAACELVETISAAGAVHEFAIAGFYTVRGGALARVKVYREGTAEPPA